MQLSEPTRKRLVILANLLQQESCSTVGLTAKTITSKRISLLTGWTDATIRRDISKLGIKCGASNGYDIQSLQDALNSVVNPSEQMGKNKCCIVGLGRMGAALLDYDGFSGAGFDLVAGFDESVNRVEVLNASFPLYPASRLEQVLAQEKIAYAVLAVPDKDANRYALRLVNAGVQGIVNCTTAVRTVPTEVDVENISIFGALRNLIAKKHVG